MAEEREQTTPLLAGRYVLGEAFASGGMGSVHLGRIVGASGFSRVVAIKRLFPGFSGDVAFRQMLLDEARFASRIRQPNVVPILDVVEAERDLYVVMEYVHGLSLAAVLGQTRGPVPTPIATAIAEAVLFGLHAAHEARAEDGTPLGIVHRDVSPQNVLVGADGVPRLIDFGIAKAATKMQVTDPGVVKGKAGYMAPEQLLHEPVSRHADVFSASVVLWEMLSNRPLFAFDVGERVRRVAERPAPPSTYAPGVDPALDAVVLRGLERDPARRFPTAEAMALELRRGHAVASAVDVARWLAEVAADELEISDERVRIFEQAPAASRSPNPDASGGNPLASAPISVGATSARAVTTAAEIRTPARAPEAMRRDGRGLLAAVGGGVAIVLVLVGFKLAPRHTAIVAIPPAPAPTESVVAITPPPAPVSPSLPSAPIVAATAPSASAATASKHAPTAPHAPRAPRNEAKAKCDPPYTLDADGFKHYDPRCF